MALLPAVLGGPVSATTTAADIIKRSLKLLGVLAAGEAPRADEAQDGLTELNLLLDSWANERLLVYGTRRSTYALTPNLSPHTLGAGGSIDTTRPLRIDMASVIAPGTSTEIPVKLLTDEEYRSVVDKTLTSTVPTRLWVEEAFPTANLWFWPVPSSAATLVLYTWSRISAFASSDAISLPAGYENALGHALALQVAPMYGVEPSGSLRENAAHALEAIRLTNQPDVVVDVDPGLLGRRTFNIYTG